MKTICVLGGSGFVGSHIVSHLKKNEDVRVIGISRSPSANCIELEYENVDELASYFDKSDVIINAVGSFKPRDFIGGQADAFNQVNNFTHNVNRAIEESTFKGRFIHISSAGTVYGEAKEKPFSETDLPKPTTWYGRLKLIEEYQFKFVCEKNDLQYICARLTNPYGNNKTKGHGFIDVLSKCIDEEKTFSASNDEKYKRDFIHVDDMVKVLYRLCYLHSSEKNIIINIGSGCSLSLKKIAETVNKQKVIVSFDYMPSEEEIEAVNIDVNKMKTILDASWTFNHPENYLKEKFKR